MQIANSILFVNIYFFFKDNFWYLDHWLTINIVNKLILLLLNSRMFNASHNSNISYNISHIKSLDIL